MVQALYAVIMEAYNNGVSTRKVDALVAALGSQSGISKSQVSRNCEGFICSTLLVFTPVVWLAALQADIGQRRLSYKGI